MGIDGNLYFSHALQKDSRSDYYCNAAFPTIRTIVQKTPMSVFVKSCRFIITVCRIITQNTTVEQQLPTFMTLYDKKLMWYNILYNINTNKYKAVKPIFALVLKCQTFECFPRYFFSGAFFLLVFSYHIPKSKTCLVMFMVETEWAIHVLWKLTTITTTSIILTVCCFHFSGTWQSIRW